MLVRSGRRIGTTTGRALISRTQRPGSVVNSADPTATPAHPLGGGPAIWSVAACSQQWLLSSVACDPAPRFLGVGCVRRQGRPWRQNRQLLHRLDVELGRPHHGNDAGKSHRGLTSIQRTRACANGERTNAASRQPARSTSPTNVALPVTRAE